jgi:hypothetical protein
LIRRSMDQKPGQPLLITGCLLTAGAVALGGLYLFRLSFRFRFFWGALRKLLLRSQCGRRSWTSDDLVRIMYDTSWTSTGCVTKKMNELRCSRTSRRHHSQCAAPPPEKMPAPCYPSRRRGGILDQCCLTHASGVGWTRVISRSLM